ncbi:MAG: sugar transferase [Candidatus Thioglobus sp.]
MKQTFDCIISLIAILLVFPILLLVAIWIKLESKGPIIFIQKRIGREGKIFLIYKFRSMIADASKKGPYFTQKEDPRITKSGRFVRKTSIDELPQLFNVLKGDMSLVGPRPNVPEQKIEYTESDWHKRNSVRPGITGLAQAKLRSIATPEERTKMDLEYVDKASFSYDLWIMILTVKQIVFKGSY